MFNELIAIACDSFKLRPKDIKMEMNRPYYSYIKCDYTEMYTKIENTEDEMATIFEFREIYNQQNYRNPMKVTLFSFVLENVVIVSRSLKQPLPGNIMLANEGCGALQIALLALLINKLTPKEFPSLSDTKFTKEKWQNDLKQVMYQLSQDIKPTVLQFNEKELQEKVVLHDINSLMAHSDLLALFNCEDRDQIVHNMTV
jgi:hypothetical protein